MSVLVLVVDDEPDVEALFRQQFRRDLRAQRFVTEFALSAPLRRPNVPVIMIAAYGDDATRLRATELGATRAAVDLTVRSDVAILVRLYLGHVNWQEVAGKALSIGGDRQMARQLPIWLQLHRQLGRDYLPLGRPAA